MICSEWSKMRVERQWGGLKGVSTDKTNRKEAESKAPRFQKTKPKAWATRFKSLAHTPKKESVRTTTLARLGLCTRQPFIASSAQRAP